MNIEFKELQDVTLNQKGIITGYASKFDEVDKVNDTIPKTAYNKWMKDNGNKPLVMLFNHDKNQVIGKWVDFTVDKIGLKVEGKLNLGSQMGKEVYELAKEGDITGLSIGYTVQDADYKKGVRVLKEIALHELSIVTFPAQESAQIESVKAYDGTTLRDMLANQEPEPDESEPMPFEDQVIEYLEQASPQQIQNLYSIVQGYADETDEENLKFFLEAQSKELFR